MEKKSKKCSFSGEESTTDSVEEEERKKRAKEKAQRQYFMQTKQNAYQKKKIYHDLEPKKREKITRKPLSD